MGRALAIANQKGGVGKTTTALNLAACLAYTGRRVLLIDLDAQGNATSGIGLERLGRGGAELLFRGGRLPAEAICETGIGNLLAVPSSSALRHVESELGRDHSRDFRLRSALEVTAPEVDFIVMDCPPSLGVIPLSALIASTGALIPIQCEYYALEGLAQIMSAIAAVRKDANRGLQIEGILLTMWDRGVQLALDVEAEVREHFGDQVYRTVIPRDPVLAEAPSHALPVVDYAPRSKATWSYVQLAKEVLANDRKKVGSGTR